MHSLRCGRSHVAPTSLLAEATRSATTSQVIDIVAFRTNKVRQDAGFSMHEAEARPVVLASFISW